MYTEEQLYQDVAKEATSLRDNLTNGEKENLQYYLLDPSSHTHCIYGLATGDCRSARASDLIEKCCVRFFKEEFEHDLKSVLSNVNGQKIDMQTSRLKPVWYCTEGKVLHFSAIEVYIFLPGARNGKLIDYIKGNTDELNLKLIDDADNYDSKD